MSKFWKMFLVLLVCAIPLFIIVDVLKFDFKVSGMLVLYLGVVLAIWAYLGYIPNVLVNKARQDKKKKVKSKK